MISGDVSKLLLWFLPRDAMQSAVLLRKVVRPSVCDIEVSWSQDSWDTSQVISWLTSQSFLLSADPNITDLFQFPKGTSLKFWPE